MTPAPSGEAPPTRSALRVIYVLRRAPKGATFAWVAQQLGDLSDSAGRRCVYAAKRCGWVEIVQPVAWGRGGKAVIRLTGTGRQMLAHLEKDQAS